MASNYNTAVFPIARFHMASLSIYGSQQVTLHHYEIEEWTGA